MFKKFSLIAACFSVVWFLAAGTHLAHAQEVAPPGVPYSGRKAPNPPPSNYVNSGSRTSRAQLQFRTAISEGNAARQKFDYGKAWSNYLKASELLPNDPHGHYGLGNVYYDVYCYNSAIALYSRALKLKPNYLDALMQLGNAYLNKDLYDEAEEQFTKAINIQPKNNSPKLARFYIWAKKGKHEEAIEGINRILNDKATSDRDRALANLALGNVFVAQKKWEESIAPFERATKLSADSSEAFVRLGMSQLVVAFSTEPISEDATLDDKRNLVAAARRASETLQTAVDVKGYEHPNAQLMLGMALMYQSSYQLAANRINHYIKEIDGLKARLSGLDPTVLQKCDYAWGKLYAQGHLQLGQIYERQADEAGADRDELLNLAVREYRESIQNKEDYASAYSALGIIYAKQRKFREAIEEYKRGLIYQTTDANKVSAHSLIGMMYGQLGQHTEAIHHINTAININPADAGSYVSLANIYTKQGNYDEAISLLTKAKDLEPQPKASTHFMLGNAYFSRAVKSSNDADHEKAIELLNQALKINSRLGYAYKALGNVYKFYKNGINVEAALRNYETAKGFDPNDAGIYFLIGDLHASVTRNYDAAIKNLNEAIRLKPDYALAYWTLGTVYQARRDYPEAIRQFREGLTHQKDTNAYFLLADTYDRQKNYAEAIKWMQEGVRLDPESHLPYLHIARFYTHWQKNDEAVTYYNEAISRLKSNDSANKNLYLCRILRLRRQYQDAISCFEKLTYPMADQVPYEMGATHVTAGNKQAALLQHQKLVELKSALADYLLEEINAMKPDQ